MNSNELQHHGILGMRWGIRRTPAQLGHQTKSNKSIASKKNEQKKSRLLKIN